MFRKYYKEANDRIKPSEDFVNSVLKNVKKRKPPAYVRYTKYAAAFAAAVVIVSGTVLSMPLWQRVTDNADGVIIEETVTDTAPPESTSSRAAANTAPTAAPAETLVPQGGNTVNSSERKPEPTKIPFQNTSEPSNAFGEATPRQTAEPEKAKATTAPQETQATADIGAPEAGSNASDEAPTLKKAVLGDTDEEMRVMSEPMDMAAYGDAGYVSEAAGASMAAIEDTDIPTPSGYRCTSATPRGYTFVNDSGAVITVTINYGGEEHAPYIEEDGENIYAVFTSFGLSVTINASGADRESVEEIITSLR